MELITVSLGSSTLRISLSLLDGALALSFRDDHPRVISPINPPERQRFWRIATKFG
uniref:Sugar transporter SWEET1 n=1 Tax=Parascaris univalens TaxID=6257 RepID=A0A915BLM7_PARUN